MPSILPLLNETFILQFNKRDHSQKHGGDDSDVKSPVVMIGLVIAALTLLVAMVPLFRRQRFHRRVSSPSIPFCIKKALGIIALPNPPLAATAARDNLMAIPVDEIPMPRPALMCGGCPSTRFVSAHSNLSSDCHNVNNVIAPEDGRVPRVEESPGPRRPEPILTLPFP